MSKYRKVVPQTQREISVSKQETYKSPEEGRGRYDATNPNPKMVNANEQSTGITHNRANELSVKEDDVKDYSVGIQDLDEAIHYYMNEVIQPTVIQNGQRINVPIIYASPERYKSAQLDGFYRDKNGAIMNPIVAFKRDSITKDRTISNKLDANGPNIYKYLNTNYQGDNPYGRFNVLNNRVPNKRFQAVVVPDFVTLSYSCIIQTYYMEQLNKIVEAMEYASDAYWGNPERYKFRAFIDTFNTVTELTEGQERLVRGTFDIRLRGYIIPQIQQKDLKAISRSHSRSKVTVTAETVVDISALDKK